MSFSTDQYVNNGISLLRLTDDKSGVSLVIAPEHGALLHEFNIPTKGGTINIIDNYPERSVLDSELSSSFKSSKLSPFPCRIAGGKYEYDGVEFEFMNKFVDGTAIHGLLYNKKFTVVDVFTDDLQASALLKYNYKQDDEGYPFSYRCEVKYTLFPDSLVRIETTIINLDDLAIPMADGWHPYFRFGTKVDDLLFYFNAAGQVEFDSKLIPTGRLLPYSAFNEERIFGDTKLDNCFLLEPPGTFASCIVRDPRSGIQLSFFPGEGYPYLQIYTPPGRDSIAIENLSAAPDSFNNKFGLLLLGPRRSHTFGLHYKVGVH